MSGLFKQKKRICLTIIACMLLVMPTTAMAETEDVGHGAGCSHQHTSSCFAYHTHDSSCYYHPGHSTSDCDITEVSGTGYCQWCGMTTSSWRITTYTCKKCGQTKVAYRCHQCGDYTFSGWDFGDPCSVGTLSCSKPASKLICTKSGYTDCIMPTLQYDFDPARMGWTNQDVTINYSGTETGSLVFTENGTKELVITSPSGHQIKDSISVMGIDKAVPDMPEYMLSEQLSK